MLLPLFIRLSWRLNIENTKPNVRGHDVPVNHWMNMNKKLQHSRWVLMGLSGLSLILFLILVVGYFRAPLVILEDQGRTSFHVPQYRSVNINKGALEEFVTEFIYTLYDWKELNPGEISKKIEPYTTSGLVERIRAQFIEQKEKIFKDKKISQGVASVTVKITDTQIVAVFDKILRINGIPLVIPSEIALVIGKSSSTRSNPMGLYINGIIEHEGSEAR